MDLAEIKALMGILTTDQAGPIPEVKPTTDRQEWAHEFMEIGEAFDKPISLWNHVQNANVNAARRLGRKFTSRSNYPQTGTVRTWRIA